MTTPIAHPVLTDMTASGGSPRDLLPPQVAQLRDFYENRDTGLWHFIRDVFQFEDAKPELHAPICRLVGHWGETHLDNGTLVDHPPGLAEEGHVAQSYRRLMVRIPRECFKTSFFTRALSLWILATRDHDATIGIFNEKEDNAASWVGAICQVVENSVLFQTLWREMIPRGIGFWDRDAGIGVARKHKWGESGALFERSKHGIAELSIEPHGVGSATAGKHFTHTVLDDIIGLKAQQSEAVMQAAKDWIDKKRPLERPAENGCEIVNHTTWAYGDVYDYMLQKWPGEYLVHSRSLLEDPTTGEPDDVAGESIFPEKYTTQQAFRMRDADPFTFAAQYQNHPKAGKSQSFNEEHFGAFRVDDVNGTFYLRIDNDTYDPNSFDLECGAEQAPQVVPLAWLQRAVLLDPAPSKKNEVKADPLARNGVVTLGVDPYGRWFFLEAIPSREGPTEILALLIAQYRKWSTGQIGIEEVNFSSVYAPLWQRIMELDPQYENCSPEFIPLLTRNRDKHQRIRDNWITRSENRRLYFNITGTGYLRKEFSEFPYVNPIDLLDGSAYGPEVLFPEEPTGGLEGAPLRRTQHTESRGQTGYGF